MGGADISHAHMVPTLPAGAGSATVGQCPRALVGQTKAWHREHWELAFWTRESGHFASILYRNAAPPVERLWRVGHVPPLTDHSQ